MTLHKLQYPFTDICPPLYRETVQAMLPQPQLERVLAWRPGPRGLALVGPTGKGKTRCAWELFRKLMDEQHAHVLAYDGIGWALAVSRAFGAPDTTEDWLDYVCSAEVLFLDDVFKGRLSEAQEHALYGVFERRTANMLPIVCTLNATGGTLLDRMTDAGRAERGEPLLRRIREFCDVVMF